MRNAYATYHQLQDSPKKLGLILYNIIKLHGLIIKDLLVDDGHASD